MYASVCSSHSRYHRDEFFHRDKFVFPAAHAEAMARGGLDRGCRIGVSNIPCIRPTDHCGCMLVAAKSAAGYYDLYGGCRPEGRDVGSSASGGILATSGSSRCASVQSEPR